MGFQRQRFSADAGMFGQMHVLKRYGVSSDAHSRRLGLAPNLEHDCVGLSI